MKIVISSLLVILALSSIIKYKTMKSENSYGEKVKYSKDQELEFPDFTLRFIGERTEHAPQISRSFRYYDFEVFTDSERKTVSWSAGTGDIGPILFRFNNTDFFLEMQSSDILGRLSENEIVVWPQERYDSEITKQFD